MYILQITKRRIGPVLAFNVQIPDQVECLAVFACWKQAQDLCVSLLFVQHLYVVFIYVKKEEIWLSPVTKTPTPTEQSKKQRDNIKTPPKTLITQLLRTDLGRSVGVAAVTQLVWLNRFTSAQPSL